MGDWIICENIQHGEVYREVELYYADRPGTKPVKRTVLRWPVETEDAERAIKVANEKRVQLIALGIWGNNDALGQLLKKGDSIPNEDCA